MNTRPLRLVPLALVCIAARSAALPSPPTDLPALQARIAAHLAEHRFRHAQWGVQIVSLDSGKSVFAHNADRLFIPASNTKLFTAALALDRFGPDFRIRTTLHSRVRPDRRGTLAGDLILYGRGDPTFAPRFHGGSLDRALDPLVDAVVQAGIKRIRGDIVADESYFVGPGLGSGWNWDDLPYSYGAEVSALSINDNAVEVIVTPDAVPGRPTTVRADPPGDYLTVRNASVTAPPDVRRSLEVDRPLQQNRVFVSGQVPVGDTGATENVSVHLPAAWFGTLFRAALEARGIRVGGRVVTRTGPLDGSLSAQPPLGVELGAVASPPLREILAGMLKPSQNLHAQLLLLQVGAAELAQRTPWFADGTSPGALPRAPRTTEAAGIAALADFLKRAGIPPNEVLFEEGSGLSRRHLVTPNSIVRLLRLMEQHRDAAVFREALPVAGVDGTLRSRLRDTPAAGNARAKTGTLRYVNALSGYVTSAAGERFAFAILLNNYLSLDPARPARADLDLVVELLAGLSGRTPPEPSPAATPIR